MNKFMLGAIIAASFVVGTMTTGTFAYAQGNGGIVSALNSIQEAITGIEPDVDVSVPEDRQVPYV